MSLKPELCCPSKYILVITVSYPHITPLLDGPKANTSVRWCRSLEQSVTASYFHRTGDVVSLARDRVTKPSSPTKTQQDRFPRRLPKFGTEARIIPYVGSPHIQNGLATPRRLPGSPLCNSERFRVPSTRYHCRKQFPMKSPNGIRTRLHSYTKAL